MLLIVGAASKANRALLVLGSLAGGLGLIMSVYEFIHLSNRADEFSLRLSTTC